MDALALVFGGVFDGACVGCGFGVVLPVACRTEVFSHRGLLVSGV